MVICKMDWFHAKVTDQQPDLEEWRKTKINIARYSVFLNPVKNNTLDHRGVGNIIIGICGVAMYFNRYSI